MTATWYSVRAELQAGAFNSSIVAEVARHLSFLDCSVTMRRQKVVAIEATVAAADGAEAEQYLVERAFGALEALGVADLRLAAVSSAQLLR